MTTNRETINQLKGTIFVQEMITKTGRGGLFWRQAGVSHYQAVNYVSTGCIDPAPLYTYWEYNVTKCTANSGDPIYTLDVAKNKILYFKATSNELAIIIDLYESVEDRSQNDDRMDEIIDASLSIHDIFDEFNEYTEDGSGGVLVGGEVVLGGRFAYWYGPVLEGSSRGEIIGNGGADIAGDSIVAMPVQSAFSKGGAELGGVADVRMAERIFIDGSGGAELGGEAFAHMPSLIFIDGSGGAELGGEALVALSANPTVLYTQILLPSLTKNPGDNPGSPWNWLGPIVSVRDSVDRPDEDASYAETYVVSSSNYDNPMPVGFDNPIVPCDFYTQIEVRVVWKIDRSVVLSSTYALNPSLTIKGQKLTTGVLNGEFLPYPAPTPQATRDPNCICGCDDYQVDVFTFYPPNHGIYNHIDPDAGSTGTYIRSYPTDYLIPEFAAASSVLWTNSDVSGLRVSMNSVGRGIRVTAIDLKVTGYPAPNENYDRVGRGGVLLGGTSLTDGDLVSRELQPVALAFQGPFYVGDYSNVVQDVRHIDFTKYIEYVVDDPFSWDPTLSRAELILARTPDNTNSFKNIRITAAWSSDTSTDLMLTLKANNSSDIIWSTTFVGTGGVSTNLLTGEWTPSELANLSIDFRFGAPGSKLYAANVEVSGPYGSTSVSTLYTPQSGGVQLGGCSLAVGGSPIIVGGANVGGEAYITMLQQSPVSTIVGSGGAVGGGLCVLEPIIGGYIGGTTIGGLAAVNGGSGRFSDIDGVITQYLPPIALVQQGSWTGDWHGLRNDTGSSINDATAIQSLDLNTPMILTVSPTFITSPNYSEIYIVVRFRQILPGTRNLYLQIYVGTGPTTGQIYGALFGETDFTTRRTISITANSFPFNTITQSDVDNIQIRLMGTFQLEVSAIEVAVVS